MNFILVIAVSVFHFCNAYPRRRFEVNLLNFNPSMVQKDGPLGMEELNMLHADAVRFGEGGDNLWFKAVDAKTLDSLITEMNEMNRWFAKVVKYWDDFTSGGDGSTVLKQNGKGIKTISEKPDGDGQEGGDAEVTGDDGAGADADADAGAGDEEPAEGDDADAAGADGDDAAAADGDAAGADGEDAGAEDADAAAADGDAADAEGDDATGDDAGDDAAAADAEGEAAAAEEDAAADGGDAAAEEKPAAARGMFGARRRNRNRMRMRNRNRRF